MKRLRAWRNVRVKLLTILLVALAAALAASTYGFNFLFARTTARSANSLLLTRANSELALLAVRNGRLLRVETADDAFADRLVWVFGTKHEVIERPPTRGPIDERAAELAGGTRATVDVAAADVRLRAVPIVIRGVRQGTLVTGISLAPYEQAERRALLGSLVLACLMLAVTGGAAWWLLNAALRPVAEMTAQADAWSEADLDRRFDRGEPHDELTLLAGTLDSMLDRIAASLRHERRFSAELSHELRTPLARVIAEVELALRRERATDEYRETLDLVLRNAQQLARIVDTLFAAAQTELNAQAATSDAYAVMTEAIGASSSVASERGIDVEAPHPAAGLRLGIEGDVAERVLQPVIENAYRYARTRVRVSLNRDGSRVVYLVEDDGPGVTDGERETIFEPGRRGAAAGAPGASVGAGLGLALARRLARAASGDVVVEPSRAGARFVITLPAG